MSSNLEKEEVKISLDLIEGIGPGVDEKAPDHRLPDKSRKPVEKIQPIITMRSTKDGHQLEITIQEDPEKIELINKANLYNEQKQLFFVLESEARIDQPITVFITEDRRPGSEPPDIIALAIISRATDRPLHYDIQGKHVTANVALSKSIII